MVSASHEVHQRGADAHNHDANSFSWKAADGLVLRGEHWKPKDTERQTPDAKIPVLCLPGLSRNTRDFSDIAEYLQSAGHHVYALDYRGRGKSDWDKNSDNYSLAVEASDIDTAIKSLELDRFVLLGTSRGGLHALAMADRYPVERMAAVIFNDVGPHLEMSALRRIANSIGQNMKHASLESVASHLKGALGLQFPVFTESDWLKLAGQLSTHREDQFILDYDPELSNVFNDLDEDKPVPDIWPFYERLSDRPVCIIRGEHSDLLSAETCERMQVSHPEAELKIVTGQGHAPVLWEQDTHEFVLNFLTGLCLSRKTV